MRYRLAGARRTADTRAYFPSREEAERFARQFDTHRYRIDIVQERRADRPVYQVLVQHLDEARHPMAMDLLRLLGTVGDRARGVGLDGEHLARSMGRALGEAMASKSLGATSVSRRQALDRLGALLQQCGLGGLSVVSVTPLVLQVGAPSQHTVIDQGRRCAHVAGFIEGALGLFLGRAPEVREVDCVGLGNSYCTFACEP